MVIDFDDYTNRPHYHLVEEFCPIEQTEVRQELFLLPAELDREEIGPELEGFLMVRDLGILCQVVNVQMPVFNCSVRPRNPKASGSNQGKEEARGETKESADRRRTL